MEFGAGPLRTSLAAGQGDDVCLRIRDAARQRFWFQTSSEHPLLRIVGLDWHLLLRTPNVLGHTRSQGDGRRLTKSKARLGRSFRKEIIFILFSLTQKTVP